MRNALLLFFCFPFFLKAQNDLPQLRQDEILPFLDSIAKEHASATWSLTGVLFTLGTSYEIRNLPFENDAHKLPVAGVEPLDSLAEFLRLYPTLQLEIRVHFSPKIQAPPLRNLDKKRAAVIRDYLAGRGVNPDRLKAVKAGYNKPIFPEELIDRLEDEDLRQQYYSANQRIEFYISESPY